MRPRNKYAIQLRWGFGPVVRRVRKRQSHKAERAEVRREIRRAAGGEV